MHQDQKKLCPEEVRLSETYLSISYLRQNCFLLRFCEMQSRKPCILEQTFYYDKRGCEMPMSWKGV